MSFCKEHKFPISIVYDSGDIGKYAFLHDSFEKDKIVNSLGHKLICDGCIIYDTYKNQTSFDNSGKIFYSSPSSKVSHLETSLIGYYFESDNFPFHKG